MDIETFGDTGGLSAEELELLAYMLEEEGVDIVEQQTILPRDQHDDPPLSFAQSRLWFLDQLNPGMIAYNTAFAVRLTGHLNIDALRRSMNEIVRRHEALRTTFPAIDGQPRQVIAPELTIDIPLIDLRALPPAERNAETYRLATVETRHTFDLANGPLMVAKLLAVGDDEHVVTVTFHHIVFDGWSVGVFLREFMALYEAYSSGQPSPLAPLPIQYADFAIWQRGWLQGDVLDQQLGYWKRQLGGRRDGRGTLPVLELPTDRPRPPRQSHRGAHVVRPMSTELAATLTALSQREGATLFMTLLAAFNVLLHRYSGQDDIVVGSPIANRDFVEIERLIGFFVNTLLLRTDLSGDPTFLELLKRVRETTLDGYAHQNVPFEKITDALQPERDLSFNPLFQTMFVLQNTEMPSFERDDLRMSYLQVESGTAMFDLLLAMVETPETFNASLEYNTDLFDPETIDRLLEQFQVLLESIAAYPARRISQLPLLSAAERRQILVEWNQTSAAYPADRCIHQLFEDQAAQTPESIAVTDGSRQLTYRELDQRANQLAHHLQSLGVGPEITVGICLERTVDLLVATFGVLKAGGAYVPLDPNYPAERLQFMLSDTAAHVLITERALDDERWSGGYRPAKTVQIDADWPTIATQPITPPASTVTADNLVYVIYTSGSTGTPKGVQIVHRGLVSETYAWHDIFELRPDDRHLEMASFSFDVFMADTCRALTTGATLVLCPRDVLLDGPRLHELFVRERITVAEFVPVVLRSLMQHLEQTDQRIDLRLIMCGSDSWYVGEYQQFLRRIEPHTRLINTFGLTETGIDNARFETRDASTLDSNQLVPIGQPLPNVRLYILDTQQQPVPIGVPGELYVGGVGLSRGYRNRQDLTDARFVSVSLEIGDGSPPIVERLYRTGDRARFWADGQIEFMGRTDYQIKIRGFRVEPGEIEAVLLRHPAIREIAVVAREPTPGDTRLVAYVVPAAETANGRAATNGHAPSGQSREVELGLELRQWALDRLPDYMIPTQLVLLDALPISPTGKIDRQALPSPDWSRRPIDETYVAPRTPTEETVAALAGQVLGVERVGVHDNFFALGGHSLLGTQLIARLRETFAVELPLRNLFEMPTVAGLAERVETIRWVTQSEAAPVAALDDDYEEGSL